MTFCPIQSFYFQITPMNDKLIPKKKLTQLTEHAMISSAMDDREQVK